jgi:peptidylprolyl isomerase
MTKQNSNVLYLSGGIALLALLLLGISSIGVNRNAASANIPLPVPNTQSTPLPPPPPQQQPQAASQPPPVQGNPVTTASGLTYIDQVVGAGPAPQPNQTVVVHYTGYLDNGAIFDSSVQNGAPVEFSLNGVIPGFSEGISTMKVGGRRRLIIPPELGYGAQGKGPVPPNARLTFDVELLGVK